MSLQADLENVTDTASKLLEDKEEKQKNMNVRLFYITFWQKNCPNNYRLFSLNF